jgi:hypothetical protein
MEGLPHVFSSEMHVDLAGGDGRSVGEQASDDLTGHTRADQLGGMGVAQHVQRELHAWDGLDPGDHLVDRGVGERPADATAPEVDEYEVRVHVAVLGVHVVRVAAHQPGGDRGGRR